MKLETQIKLEKDLEFQEIIKSCKDIKYLTRKEEQEIKFLERELKKIKAKREEAKLNYIYKEFFSSDNPDFNFKYTKLEKELQKDYNSFHSKLYNLLKLTVSKKSKETKTF